MATEIELFGVKYKEGSLDPKAAELIKFAVNWRSVMNTAQNSTSTERVNRAPAKTKCGRRSLTPCAPLLPKCETSPRISSVDRSDCRAGGVSRAGFDPAHRPNLIE
jgi:hypothetical protein